MTTHMQAITDNLDLWTSALLTKSTSGRGSNGRLEAYGIKKLRELILELAVRGKLVPQDSNDEPASELLGKIAQEKERLIKEGKIKRQKPFSQISEEEKLFPLPSGWAWCRWDEIALKIGDIDHMMPEEVNEGFPYVSPRDFMPNNQIDLEGAKKISENDFLRLATKIQPQQGDIIYPRYGTIGENRLVETERDFLASYSCCVIKTMHDYIVPKYQFIFSISEFTKGQATKAENKTTQANVGIKSIQAYVLPLPPLAEQHRIVAKVNELMALCDQLEQQQTNNIEAHQILVETLLGTLTNVESQEVFTEAWTRIANHFDTLFTTEQSIDQLKQTILQLAVMGILVPQDPNDEPASALLDKIAKAKVGKFRKEEPSIAITENEKPFSLPSSWSWTRLDDLSPEFQNGASSRGDKEGKDVVVLRLADIDNWKISLRDTRTLTISKQSIDKYSFKRDDILIIRVNGSADLVGRFILCDQGFEAIYCDHFIRMRFQIESFIPKYLVLLASSNLVRDKIKDLFISTAGQKTVNQRHIGSLVVAVPPKKEQHRIVAKVNELMTLCDSLKARLAAAQTTQIRLADTIVEQAVA